MSSTTHPPVTPRPTSSRVRWREIPTALWLYGVLRALAFAAPAWSSGGRVGLGAVVVAFLFVKIVRRSRPSWLVLAWLDVVSFVVLMTAWLGTENAVVAVPVLSAAATLTLFAPSTRRYVAGAGRT